jgi:hypothetical protein
MKVLKDRKDRAKNQRIGGAGGKEPLMDFANGEILEVRLRLIAFAISEASTDRRW